MRLRSQPAVSIILPQKHTILGPGSEHPVRLIYTFCNKVIYKHTYESFMPGKDKRILLQRTKTSINASNQSLTSSLFITGSTIDLPGKI